jgi:hypothetical protein
VPSVAGWCFLDGRPKPGDDSEKVSASETNVPRNIFLVYRRAA